MRLFEYEERGERYYFRVELKYMRVEIHFGPFGTEGSRRMIELDTEEAAEREYQRQIAACLERGCLPLVDETVTGPPPPKPDAIEATATGLSESPRFLFVHRARKEFVWVEARDRQLLVATGPLGAEGTTEPTVEQCTSPAVAVKRRDRKVNALLSSGFELDAFGAAASARPPD